MMDKRQVFDLARKAGFVDWTDDGDWQGTDCDLIRLVKMAFELGVKDGPDYKNGFADGAFEERKAICDIVDYELDSNGHAEAIKLAIRARGTD
jgi:hypothetical protein